MMLDTVIRAFQPLLKHTRQPRRSQGQEKYYEVGMLEDDSHM